MLRNSQRFRSVVYIYYPFPMNGTIQESRIIPSIIIVPKTILRTKIARAIQTPAYYHNNQRNTSPRNEKKYSKKKNIIQIFPPRKGNNIHSQISTGIFSFQRILRMLRNVVQNYWKFSWWRKILFRRRRKAGTFTDSRQPQRNSIDRETRVYIFRGELNCSQNALVTETSENLVQWFLAVCDRWRG